MATEPLPSSYDDFAGPTLLETLWEPLDIGSGPRLEPEARTTVEDGVLTVDVPRFANCDPGNQMLDNSKHVIFGRRGFRIPADGVGRFSVELDAEILNEETGDYRLGTAAFIVADTTGGTHTVFNVLSTGDRVFAEQEVLPVPGQEDPFTRVIEDPFFLARAGSSPDRGPRRCSIELDRSRGRVVWTVDDEILHVAAGLTGLPEEVHMGLGLFTLLPVGDGEGSCRGQGARVSWRNFEYSLPAES